MDLYEVSMSMVNFVNWVSSKLGEGVILFLVSLFLFFVSWHPFICLVYFGTPFC